MIITRHYEIEDFLKNRLCEIAETCQIIDGLMHPFFTEDDPEMLSGRPVVYCMHESNDKIVGFISIYALDTNAAEVCSFVLPNHRRKGIFNAVINELLHDYDGFETQFPICHVNTIGTLALKSVGYNFSSTECKLVLNKKKFTPRKSDLQIEVSAENDVLCYTAFHWQLSRTTGNSIYVDECLISALDTVAIIHDVSIKKEYRSKGLGTQMLNLILQDLLSKGFSYIGLHVTKSNVAAYLLYKHAGFELDQNAASPVAPSTADPIRFANSGSIIDYWVM